MNILIHQTPWLWKGMDHQGKDQRRTVSCWQVSWNQGTGRRPPGMSNHAIGASSNTDWPGSTKTCLRTLIGSKNGACNPMNTPSASQWLWSHLPHSTQWFPNHSSDSTTLLQGSLSILRSSNEYHAYEGPKSPKPRKSCVRFFDSSTARRRTDAVRSVRKCRSPEPEIWIFKFFGPNG